VPPAAGGTAAWVAHPAAVARPAAVNVAI
jgi:hypothetical protein